MNITRRSFVKKTSYSAAAVTVLGTGVGLADAGSSANPLMWESWEMQMLADKTITVTSTEELNLTGLNNDLILLDKLVRNAIVDSSNGFTTSIANVITVTYDHAHGGDHEYTPPKVHVQSGNFVRENPTSGTFDAATGLYSYVVTVKSGYTFKMRKEYRY